MVDRVRSSPKLRLSPKIPTQKTWAQNSVYTFARIPESQWKSIRSTYAIERLHEEFKRRIKTQIVLPRAETAAMLLWALLAWGQNAVGKVDGWQSVALKPSDDIIDLAA